MVDSFHKSINCTGVLTSQLATAFTQTTEWEHPFPFMSHNFPVFLSSPNRVSLTKLSKLVLNLIPWSTAGLDLQPCCLTLLALLPKSCLETGNDYNFYRRWFLEDGSVEQGACCQVWLSEFGSLDPHGGRKEWAPCSRPLTSTWIAWSAKSHTHAHKVISVWDKKLLWKYTSNVNRCGDGRSEETGSRERIDLRRTALQGKRCIRWMS